MDAYYYYLLKELYTVAGLADMNGNLATAYTCDAYGKVAIFRADTLAGDSDADGDVDIEDFGRFENCFGLDVTTYTQCAWADLDSGSTVVDLDDFVIFASCFGGQGENVAATGDYNDNGIVDVGDGEALDSVCYSGPGNPPSSGCEILDLDGDDDVDADDRGLLMYLLDTLAGQTVSVCITPFDADQVNPYFFTGRALDIVDGKQIADHRARSYDVGNGRWMQRDPSGYSPSLNLYEYVTSSPSVLVDSHGLVPHDNPHYDPNNPHGPNGRGSDPSEPSHSTVSVGIAQFEIVACRSGATVFIAAGAHLTATGQLRLEYARLAASLRMSGLSKAEQSAARDILKLKFREIQTTFGEAYTEAVLKSRAGTTPTRNNPSSTNAGINQRARQFVKVGRCLIVVGIAVDIVTIAQAPTGERPTVFVRTVGSMGGGIAGAEIGACCGSPLGVPGVVIGGIAGGFMGACGGDIVGGWIADDVTRPRDPLPPCAQGEMHCPYANCECMSSMECVMRAPPAGGAALPSCR